MNKLDEKDQIIKEYHESKAIIRKIIGEYEAQEARLFKIMLDRLQQSVERNYPCAAIIGSEQ